MVLDSENKFYSLTLTMEIHFLQHYPSEFGYVKINNSLCLTILMQV